MSFRRDLLSDPDRCRASEGLGPRPSELLADRLYAAAAFAKLTELHVDIDGARHDGEALAALADLQRGEEDELIGRWHHFRGYYEAYLVTMRTRETTLHAALDAFAAATGDRAAEPAVRSALRLCRLRRPPLAKVEALVAEASGPRQALAATASRRRLR